MRRFLVVGCGGSGAVTLAYMMDQLRSDLARVGVRRIPSGWQFVSIDVPSAPGGLPKGLRNVRDQQGDYFGAAPQGERYSVLDNALSQMLSQRHALDTIATWAPRDPGSVPVPVTSGAGQYRAVGRMITLNQAAGISRRLQAAWERLNTNETDTEMRELAVAGSGRYEPEDAPLVLVVSSMAGGSGASMALDVCRLLTQVDRGPDPRTIGVFMVTADVFDHLGPTATSGVKPNSLAMLGEIIAGQLGSARDHDVELLTALGEHRGAGETVPFARVFPVSRTMGAHGTPFGDGTQSAIYRGLARGLAGLMMSDTAAAQFIDYDLTNSAAGVAGEREYVGWGARYWDNLPWGSFGFSSLSMGRDRYGEYAAQRLARSSVDLLLDGHADPTNRASDDQQIDALLDHNWSTVLSRTRLGVAAPQRSSVLDWVTTVLLPPDRRDPMLEDVVRTVLRPAIPAADGRHANQWVPDVYRALGDEQLRARLRVAADRWADEHAFHWYPGVARAIEQEIADAIATTGLPYATAMRHRFAAHFADFLRPGAEDLAKLIPSDITDLPAGARKRLAQLRGQIRLGEPVIRALIDDLRPRIEQQIMATLCARVAALAAAIVPEMLNPLLHALDEPHGTLRRARRKPETDVGLATLSTDQYAAWPTDSVHVPRRFVQANNEVMLTVSTEFAEQYARDLPRAVVDGGTPASPANAARTAARTVVAGLWNTTDGSQAPGVDKPLIHRATEWQPKVFAVDPRTGEQLPAPTIARYEVRLGAHEILDRARAFVQRDGESFERFVRVSLREFVADPKERESVLAQRRELVAARFVDALRLARPLTSVNNDALSVLHPREPLSFRYKFSEVPFADMPIAETLRATITSDTSMAPTVPISFESALTNQDGLTRINIFGSFPNYSPLVFGSVLVPAARQWDQSNKAQKIEFWKWRRARPLTASLPMHEAERQAMIAGWFLGLGLGLIALPASHEQPVRVWDIADGLWRAFPSPLLTPPDQHIGPNDWLPAVLESILLAMAHAHNAPVLESMRPYRALRCLWDDSLYDPVISGSVTRSAEKLMVEWLTTGVTRSGRPPVEDIAVATTPQKRADALVAWYSWVRDYCGRTYLPQGEDGASGRGEFSEITSRETASRTPLFRDLAPDVHLMLGELLRLVDICLPIALTTKFPEPPDGSGPRGPRGGGTF
ncbi:tubulin-like doman-containing protein [Nocardia takedensis]|uniref:tubulin-like doman-containing protein n=1 Tax=Nocardia takedensis TaxID=259390 RepID=UPI003F75AD87